MVNSLRSCLICLLLLAQNVLFGATIERDSFRFLLSRLFSEVVHSGEGEIEVALMDAPVIWSICDCRNKNQFRYIEGGEKVRLAWGDCLHFCLAGLSVNMEVSLTNGAYRSEFIRVPDQFVDSEELMVFADRGGKIRTDEKEPRPCRWFVYDVDRHELFDAQNGSFVRFDLPFHALWKDWDDYEENFSGAPKVDFMASGCGTAQFLRKRAEKSQTLREFCKGLTNDAPCVVRYWTERFITDLVLVRRRSVGFDVLGVAEVEQGGRISVFVLDERGRLRWWSVHTGTDSKFAYIYEFDAAGVVRRFVELDSSGRELRRRFRRFKDGKMVAPTERAAFRAEAEAAVRPLTEAWASGRYAAVPNVPPPSPEETAREAEREREERAREDRYMRINEERRAAGPDGVFDTDDDITSVDEFKLREQKAERERRGLGKLKD